MEVKSFVKKGRNCLETSTDEVALIILYHDP